MLTFENQCPRTTPGPIWDGVACQNSKSPQFMKNSENLAGVNVRIFCGPSVAFFFCFLILMGCATADFKPYSGQQQNWPTAQGAFVDLKHKVPIYYGFPDKPYEVLGILDTRTAPIRGSDAVPHAARQVEALGGDAIIVLSNAKQFVGMFETGSARTDGSFSGYANGNSVYGNFSARTSQDSFSMPMYSDRACVLVIKFK